MRSVFEVTVTLSLAWRAVLPFLLPGAVRLLVSPRVSLQPFMSAMIGRRGTSKHDHHDCPKPPGMP
jgi:hypothetical protein